MRFLIVDDSEVPLSYLESFLEDMGHEIVGIARNGLEAVEAFRESQPEAVVMDVIMPHLNGLDALDKIRAIDAAVPVVMTSCLRSCDTALEAEERGASYCLFKPFDPIRLRKVINRLANKGAPQTGQAAGANHNGVKPPQAPTRRA